MLRNHKVLKCLAVFFMLEIVTNVLLPVVSWALTSGPTAPEATSFEPVDTTDMVNLATGDLAYNIPLLEVPGPSGGYPLSLSYHAGIQPNEDASWVGVGWSLNPGAINRSVNGYPDDHSNITDSDRSFWEGGTSRSYQLGVNIGTASAAGISAGLTYSEDTYMGSGVGYYYGARVSEPGRGWFSSSLSHQRGVSPYGDHYSSTGLSVGIGKGTQQGYGGTAGVGVSVDGNEKISGTASVGISKNFNGSKGAISLLDASISTNGSGNFGVGGTGAKVNNSQSGNISTKGHNYNVEIPTPWNFSIQLGKSYQRYWIDETEGVSTNGSLYFPSALPSSTELDSRAYDVYDMVYANQSLSNNAPDENLVGSFIDYDHYQVLGQGIAGTMRPYHYKSYLLRQNKKDGNNYRVKSYPLAPNHKPSFRFIGDFSNRYLHDVETDQFDANNSNLPLSFQFNAQKKTGESGADGYDEDNNVLPGSKHIEFFTNAEILDKSPGGKAMSHNFIDCIALGFNNTDPLSDIARPEDQQIGGFKVVNSSGVVYYYALPVYSFDEYQYSGRIDEQGKHHFNTYRKPAKYAYTWLLTAVTGPDFIDTNSNGVADSGDYGYWVAFDYGKWTPAYSWRNPAVGFNRDIDQDFETFSKGKKEIYYLNAIRTQTHTALFVKAGRYDGKGTVAKFEEAVRTGGNHAFRDVDDGGFEPREITGSTRYPASTMRLDKIYLLQNSDIADIPEFVEYVARAGGSISHGYPDHQWSSVVDDLDLQAASSLLTNRLPVKALRIIELKTDYSLSPGTANSYVSPRDAEVYGIAASMERRGKLTLKAVKTYGKGGVSLIPETRFAYDKEERFVGWMQSREVFDPIENTTVPAWYIHGLDFEKETYVLGEIIKWSRENVVLYGFVSEVSATSGEIRLLPLQDNWERIPKPVATVFVKTKNPPYEKDHYDLWGHYKVDYGTLDENANENDKRRVTATSAQAVDVWSLKEITSSLGAKVRLEYQSDVYRNAIKSLTNIPIKNIELTSLNKTKITLHENLSTYGLENGMAVNLRFLNAVRHNVVNPSFHDQLRFDCNGAKKDFLYKWYANDTYNSFQIQVESVSGNSFVIDHNFVGDLNLDPYGCLEKQYPYSEQTHQPNHVSCVPVSFLNSSQPIFLGGEVIFNSPFSPYGGGIRVSKISVQNNDVTRSTIYTYENGVTTYEPVGYAIPVRKVSAIEKYSCLDAMEQEQFNKYRDRYIQDIYKRFGALFANSRELPSPGVLYEQVAVREEIERQDEIIALPGKTVYQFEVFSPKSVDLGHTTGHDELVGIFRNQYQAGTTGTQIETTFSNPVLNLNLSWIEKRSVSVVKDFSAIMGSLKRVTLYDGSNNKIAETINEYLHDNFSEASFQEKLNGIKEQGTIVETFADARIIVARPESNPNTYGLYGLLSQKIRYPSIQTGQTTINYKTGITTTSRNLAFDYYSGEVTKVLSSDGYGNAYVDETIPAYHVGPYAQGMQMGALGGKNMLTQAASSFSLKVIPTDNSKPISDSNYHGIGLVGASVQTWSDQISVLNENSQPGIWRKSGVFQFIGTENALRSDGLYPFTGPGTPPFNAWDHDVATPEGWLKGGQIELYDANSNALEASDLNGLYAATKMSLDQTKVFANASNSRYREFAYSGAEETVSSQGFYGGGVRIANGEEKFRNGDGDTWTTHTGNKALKLSASNQKTFQYTFLTEPNRRYQASVWVNGNGGRLHYNLNGVTATSASPSETRKAGDWYLIVLDIPPSAQSVPLDVLCATADGDCYFDDFRVRPTDASITSYVYNEWGELSHILDQRNMFTHFKYDAAGRLVESYRETFQHEVVKSGASNYHYKNQ